VFDFRDLGLGHRALGAHWWKQQPKVQGWFFGSLVNGSICWPFHGEGRMIRINTDTLDTTVVDLPEQVDAVDGCNFKARETKDGELCIIYHS
jgi:hypothetical protein